MMVYCFDGKERLGKIRGKFKRRVWIQLSMSFLLKFVYMNMYFGRYDYDTVIWCSTELFSKYIESFKQMMFCYLQNKTKYRILNEQAYARREIFP